MYRMILLPSFTLVLLVLMWANVFYQLEQEGESAHYDAVQHSHSLARTLAEHSGHLLRQADHATQLFKLKFEETDGALRLPEFVKRGGLLDSVMPARLELPIALIDANGRLVDSMHGMFPPNSANLGFFKTLATTAGDAALVTNPMVDPLTKKWQIQIARRLDDRAGKFAGAIVLMIDPAYFVEDYDRLHVQEGGLVMLISRDTALVTGRVDEKLFISDVIDYVAPADPINLPEELLLKTPIDKIDRIYGFRDMPRYSLTAVVGDAKVHALAKFYNQRRLYFAVTTVVSIVVLAFSFLLTRQARRLRESIRESTEAREKLHAAVDASLDALFLIKACRSGGTGGEIMDFTLADVNERGARTLGYPAEEALGKRMGDMLPQWRSEGFFDKCLGVLRTGEPLEEELESTLFGESSWVRHQIVAIEDGVAVTARNITERKRQELAVRRNQAELQAVNDASPLGLVRADAEGKCTYVNRTFEAITGMARDAALGDGWFSAVHPNDREMLQASLRHLTQTQQAFQETLRCVHPDGKIVWTSIKVAPIVIDNVIGGYVGTLDDITLVRKSVMALRESESRLRTIADTLPAMIAYIDFEEVYRFHNLAYEREFSKTGLHVTGRTVLETVGEKRYAVLQPYIARALGGETLTFEEDDESGDYPRTFDVVYIPQLDEDGITVVGFHVMRQDVTAQKREKQRLLRLSQVDALTGLTNRAGFLQKLSETMTVCRDSGNLMAVMYLDIDRFKPVNDTYGHAVGDALLKAFSARLSNTVRASDTVARLGGDEFTIIMDRISKPEDAAATASKIVHAMQQPFELDGVLANVSTSIGLTFYRDEDVSPAELLKRADLLLYEAKQAGRNTFRSGAPIPEMRSPNAA
ncbi:sensor domain-containing diguanylate cyclase [Pseudoduganella sp. OTU4001]|uniref:sensor domain-containing diguanylate cyclase n=1 Tax=Pseudoduganella sp. OTU4001 TaxID=3043854 RepID=UPI00313B137F